MSKKLFLLAMVSTSFAFAEQEVVNDRYYVQGNLGYATGVAPGGNFEQNTFGNARVYGISLGYKFDNNIRAGWSLEYRNGFKNKYYASDVDDIDRSRVTKVRSLSSFIDTYYDLPKINKITPYVFVGLGIARNVTQSNAFLVYPDGGAYRAGFKSGYKVSLAWKVGVGANYEFNKSTDLGLFYQYVDLGKAATGRAMIFPNGEVDGDRNQGKLKSHEFLANIKYSF